MISSGTVGVQIVEQQIDLDTENQRYILFTQCWEVYCAAPGRCQEPTWRHGSVVGPDG